MWNSQFNIKISNLEKKNHSVTLNDRYFSHKKFMKTSEDIHSVYFKKRKYRPPGKIEFLNKVLCFFFFFLITAVFKPFLLNRVITHPGICLTLKILYSRKLLSLGHTKMASHSNKFKSIYYYKATMHKP